MKIDFATRCKKLFLLFSASQFLLAGAPKGTKNALFPGAKRKTYRRFSTAPNRRDENPFLHMRAGAKGCLSRRHQRQRIPGVGRSAGGLSFKPNRGVEMAARPFRLPREYKRKRRFFALLCAYKRGWLPGIGQKEAAD